MKDAPVFVDAYQVALELGRLRLKPPEFAERARGHALALLECIHLALKGYDTAETLHEADVVLVRLRLGVRLLIDLEPVPGLLPLIEKLDDIGRQIGGWKKRLGRL